MPDLAAIPSSAIYKSTTMPAKYPYGRNVKADQWSWELAIPGVGLHFNQVFTKPHDTVVLGYVSRLISIPNIVADVIVYVDDYTPKAAGSMPGSLWTDGISSQCKKE